MKILCPACESPMHIIRSKQISQEVREFVGDCKNIDCGSRAAMLLSFSHYIRLPETNQKNLLIELLSNLSDEEKSKVLSAVS